MGWYEQEEIYAENLTNIERAHNAGNHTWCQDPAWCLTRPDEQEQSN